MCGRARVEIQWGSRSRRSKHAVVLVSACTAGSESEEKSRGVSIVDTVLGIQPLLFTVIPSCRIKVAKI